MYDNLIEMRNINKSFNNIKVLNNISLIIKGGEIHSLYGENGAGKSVLMRILSGVILPDSGEIYVHGKKADIYTPTDAQNLGIRSVHQYQTLLSDLTVAENMFITNVSLFVNKFNLIERNRMFVECDKFLKELNFNISAKSILGELSVSEQRMVELAKSLVCKPGIVIIDELTSCLTEYERNNLYNILDKLKSNGVSIIFISHYIEEILKISDLVSVIRNGEIVATDSIKNMNKESLIKLSAGKDFKERYPKLPVKIGRVLFKAVNLSSERKIKNITFNLRKGEILGVAGLVGSGRTAIARAIFGLDKLQTGEMYLNGTKLNIRSPHDAIKSGIGYVSEDKLSEGLIGDFYIPENITLTSLKSVMSNMLLSPDTEKIVARKFIKKLVVNTPMLEQKVKFLSGGNQQKVSIAKWLFGSSKLLIFDEPTSGLDLGSKVEVYNIMNDIVRSGTAIILISSDLSELIGMCDRIIVLCNGEITAELNRDEFNMEKVLFSASEEK